MRIPEAQDSRLANMMYAGNTALSGDYDNYMERRKSMRRPSEGTNVLLDIYELGYLRGEISDVSYEGMFINTLPTILYPNTSVELLFNIDGDVRRAEAYVIRRNSKGVGLWIDRQQKCNEWLIDNILPNS